MKPILEVRNLSVEFAVNGSQQKAVRDVSFTLMPGEIMGLAGESGSGKTTVGLSILRLLQDNGRITSGEIVFNDQDLLGLTPKQMRQIRWKEISMVFQGAMNAFNPVRRMKVQLTDVLTLRLKMSKKEATQKAKDLVSRLGISEGRIENFPHEFSGGMRQRAMVAMALICNPKLVIADEPTTALDVMTKAQMLELLKELRSEFNVSMIVISHDLSALAEVCDTVAIMNQGELVEIGPVQDVFRSPKHPYTQRLLATIPRLEGENQLESDILEIHSEVVGTYTDSSCVYIKECPLREEQCFRVKPEQVNVKEAHGVKCHLYA